MCRCFPIFSGILSRILVIAAIFISAVSGQECTDTVGSLSHDSKIVTQGLTFILNGYTVPCNRTVVAWEFCYQKNVATSVTFYPGIWRMTGTTGANKFYALVQSNNITYNASIQTSGTSNDQCQRVNLSVTDQFTAPAGSVVGLYSGIGPILLHTNTDSSITTYQFSGNQSSVTINPGANPRADVNYNIAIRLRFVQCSRLTDPNNGVITCSLGDDGVSFYEDTCNFTCNAGYELTGSYTRTCQSNGNWSGSNVTCRRASISDTTTVTPTTSSITTSNVTPVTITTSMISTDKANVPTSTTDDGSTMTSVPTISSVSIITAINSEMPIVPTVSSTKSTPAVSSNTMTTSTAMITSTMSIMASSPMMSSVITPVMGSADTQSSSDSSDGSSVGIIAGCIIGVVLCITLLLLVVILLWYFSRRRKGKVNLSQGTQNYELAAAKCDMSQDPTGTIDSSNYYSTIGDQPHAKQTDNSNILCENKVSNYETPSGIFGYEDSKGSNPYSDTKGKNYYSKVASNDYEAIHNTDDYASAAQVYSNYISKSTNYDDTIVSEYSEVGDAANDEEEIYSDPGHSEADIYACFEKKKFRMIKRNDISFLQKLGSGEFGTVHLGLWTKGSADPVQVAVKTLNSQCSESDRVKFLREAAIMGQFEGDNIIRLHGVVTEVRDAIIVLEYMSKGDLREFLIDLKNTTPPEALHELKHDLLSYCRHVAAGLNVLSSKGFVHRDLAARNILVSSDDVCKIADFGMARDVTDDIYYVSTGGKIPVRWTAPEAIFYRKYSVKSDVWSFGCVMYEIWSLGHKPFEEDDIREYIKKITTGHRLPPPPGCPRVVYELMIKCWHPVAKQRIDSSAIVKTLQQSDRALLPGTISAKHNEELSTTLGDPLSTSGNLYQDLQNTYLFTDS